jgi:hypothetical protein
VLELEERLGNGGGGGDPRVRGGAEGEAAEWGKAGDGGFGEVEGEQGGGSGEGFGEEGGGEDGGERGEEVARSGEAARRRRGGEEGGGGR